MPAKEGEEADVPPTASKELAARLEVVVIR